MEPNKQKSDSVNSCDLISHNTIGCFVNWALSPKTQDTGIMKWNQYIFIYTNVVFIHYYTILILEENIWKLVYEI